MSDNRVPPVHEFAGGANSFPCAGNHYDLVFCGPRRRIHSCLNRAITSLTDQTDQAKRPQLIWSAKL
jgi:hypothetical protein